MNTTPKIDFKSEAVFLRTDTGNICQLQKLGTERWGFVCLTCPVNTPLAQSVTASSAVGVAVYLGFDVHTTPLKDFRALLGEQFPAND